MDEKLRKLQATWDKNSIEVVNSSVPTKMDVEKSKDFIYGWLKDIRMKNGKIKLKMLDEGCGIGQYVTGAGFLGFEAEGLDISPVSVKLGRERGEKITLGDMRNLPFKNNSFDVVIAGGSMEHFIETDKGLAESSRILKTGGDFLLNVPYRYSIYVLLKNIQQALGLWKSGYEKSFSERDFRKRLNKAGFKVMEVKKTRISGGRRFPFIVKIIGLLDEPFYRLGFGGHHIWFRCIKK